MRPLSNQPLTVTAVPGHRGLVTVELAQASGLAELGVLSWVTTVGFTLTPGTLCKAPPDATCIGGLNNFGRSAGCRAWNVYVRRIKLAEARPRRRSPFLHGHYPSYFIVPSRASLATREESTNKLEDGARQKREEEKRFGLDQRGNYYTTTVFLFCQCVTSLCFFVSMFFLTRPHFQYFLLRLSRSLVVFSFCRALSVYLRRAIPGSLGRSPLNVLSCIMYHVCNECMSDRVVFLVSWSPPSLLHPPLSFVLSFFGVHPPLSSGARSFRFLPSKVNPLRACNTRLNIAALGNSCCGLEEETNVTYCSTAQVLSLLRTHIAG